MTVCLIYKSGWIEPIGSLRGVIISYLFAIQNWQVIGDERVTRDNGKRLLQIYIFNENLQFGTLCTCAFRSCLFRNRSRVIDDVKWFVSKLCV